jgi:hypothetical protein
VHNPRFSTKPHSNQKIIMRHFFKSQNQVAKEEVKKDASA